MMRDLIYGVSQLSWGYIPSAAEADWVNAKKLK